MGKYRYMNLEQKLAKIRKKMPLLMKKHHNEEENYDFVTLDDIYESLTPALNKYGVNFEIVKETPTQYGPEGNPVYLTLDQNNFWRYEADLEICWINIDNPGEVNHAVTHIVGTHEIPDKAHGTALTYGLKYYFRNKFCMRQLGSVQEDPDGMEYGREETDADKKGDPSSKDSMKKADKTVSANLEEKSGKDRKQTAESEGNRISGNAIPEPEETLKREESGKTAEAEPDVRRNNAGKGRESGSAAGKDDVPKPESSRVAPKEPERGSAAGKDIAQKSEVPERKVQQESAVRSPKQQESTERQEETEDGFHTAGKGEVPFDDSSFLDELEQEMEEQTEHADSDLEAAKNYVCTFGLYNGKTLGEMMNSGIKCREAVKWIANRYKGTDQEMVAAAKLLLENQDLVVEQQAA